MNSGDPVQTRLNSDLGHCFHILQTEHMAKLNVSCTFTCVKATTVRPQILKTHVAGIEVSCLFDLKKDHAVFAFDVS